MSFWTQLFLSNLVCLIAELWLDTYLWDDYFEKHAPFPVRWVVDCWSLLTIISIPTYVIYLIWSS